MNRNPGLDLLRSIAIILVMCWHFPSHGGLSGLAWTAQHGLWGVDLFFVLSGYLIGNQILAALARDGRFEFRRFYLRRFLRTLPNYLVVVALYFVFASLREKSEIPPLWKFLTFTQNFGLQVSALSHAWSLCIEEQFYVVLPLAVVFISRVRKAWFPALVLGVLFVGGACMRAWIWSVFVAPNGAPSTEPYMSLIYYPTWSRLDGLLVGVTIALLKNAKPLWWGPLVQKGNWFLFAGLAGCVATFFFLDHRTQFWPVVLGFPMLALSFGSIVIAALSPRSFLSRAHVVGASWIATLSYALYLVHKSVYHVLSRIFISHGLMVSSSRFALAALLASAAVAALLHVAIERPFLRLRDRIKT